MQSTADAASLMVMQGGLRAYSLGAALRKHNVKKSTLGEAGGGAKKKPSAGRGRSSATPSDWSTGCKKPVRRGDDSSGWSSAS